MLGNFNNFPLLFSVTPPPFKKQNPKTPTKRQFVNSVLYIMDIFKLQPCMCHKGLLFPKKTFNNLEWFRIIFILVFETLFKTS